MSARHAHARRPLAPTAPLRGAALLAAAAGLAAPAAGQTYSWNTGNGSWGTPANWSPGGPPAALSEVRIGTLAGGQNSTVLMGGGIDHVLLNGLEISDGMTLDTNGTELSLNWAQTASIMGANSRLIARPDVAGKYEADFGGELLLGPGAYFDIRDNAIVGVGYYGSSQGTISGRGEMIGGILFINDGVIDPDNNGGLLLRGPSAPWPGTIQSVNLDGDYGSGDLLLNTPFSVLEVRADELTDPFSGTITMVPGALLTMDIGAGWTADGPSLISVAGNSTPAAASQIAGSAFTFGGTMGVGGTQGHLRVLAPIEFEESASVVVGDGDHLELDGETTVWGGEFDVGDGASLTFEGPTTVRGGLMFVMGDGSVRFLSDTVYNGSLSVDGRASQIGDATVFGATAVDASVFEMDGGGADTIWDVGNSFVVNTEALRAEGGVDRFDGTLNVSGGWLASLTLNIDDPGAMWFMGGEMNLSGGAPFFLTRLAGTRVGLQGDLNISGRVRIAAESSFQNNTVTIETPTDALQMSADTLVFSDTVFQGQGTLQNAPTGLLRFATGVDLDQAGLVNQGRFLIGTLGGPGLLEADRFQNQAGATWEVGIGGEAPGTEHDVLALDGAAELAGTLEVALIDAGAGVFAPQIGDQFTILRAGSIAGTFDTLDLPPLPVGRKWQVQYSPGGLPSVVLRVTDWCYTDCNTDGALTVADFGCFQTKFVGGSPYADCNADGVLTVADFGCFQTQFVSGCP